MNARIDLTRRPAAAPVAVASVCRGPQGTNGEKVTATFRTVTSAPQAKSIFGGIMCCNNSAEGVIAVAKEAGPSVMRREKTDVKLGAEITQDSGLNVIVADNLSDGAMKIVKAANGVMLRSTLIGLMASVLASTAPAQADPIDLFEATCVQDQLGYDHQLRAARALGWTDGGSHTIFTQAVANYQSIDRYVDVAGFTQGEAILLVAHDGAILVCRVIFPDETATVDSAAFESRFNPMPNSVHRQFNTIRYTFFSSTTAAPQPPYPLVGDNRPKTDIGLTGLVLTASSFTG